MVRERVRVDLRPYRTADLPALARLFYRTVHTVCVQDYTPTQLDAWASGSIDEAAWDASLRAHVTRIAEVGGEIVGFGDMDEAGYLDRLYVAADWQHIGIATAICDALEAAVPSACYTTHASITARTFFERRGYRVRYAQEVERRGVKMTNYVMEKKKSRA